MKAENIVAQPDKLIGAVDFAALKIDQAEPGFYSAMLYSWLERGWFIVSHPKLRTVPNIADVVLARAQLHLCGKAGLGYETSVFLAAFNTLANARAKAGAR